jgi:hypothetical protein
LEGRLNQFELVSPRFAGWKSGLWIIVRPIHHFKGTYHTFLNHDTKWDPPATSNIAKHNANIKPDSITRSAQEAKLGGIRLKRKSEKGNQGYPSL